MKNWKGKSFTVLAVVLLVPLFRLNIRSSHDWGDDFAQYIQQAINLVEGKPQSENGFIYNPDYPFLAPQVYPVGYPMMLAPVYYFFGNNIVAFNYFQTFILCLFGICIFYFFRKFMNDFLALLLMLAIAYNPWMLEFKTEIIADLPFSLLLLLSLLSYFRFKEKLNWSSAALTGSLIAFTALIRPLGFILIAAFAMDSLITHFKKKDFKNIPLRKYAAVILTVGALYFLVNHVLIPSATESVGHFHNLYQTTEKWNKRFNINASYYMERFQELFKYTNPDWDLFVIVLKAFALTLLLLGFFGKIFNRFGILEILSLLYFPFVLFFPNTTQGFRYLLPLLPVMLLYVYYGFESIQLGKLNRKVVLVIACSFCLFQYKNPILKIKKEQNWILQGPQEVASQEAFAFIRNNTKPDEVIAFIKPRALALYTQRKTLTNSPAQDLNTMKDFFAKNNAHYFLFLKDIPNSALDDFLVNENDSVELLWRNEKFMLFREKS